MTSLTGISTLSRLILRRDRVRIVLWIVRIAALVLAVASSIKCLYPNRPRVPACRRLESKPGLEHVAAELVAAFRDGVAAVARDADEAVDAP